MTESSAGGALLDPVPVGWNSVFGGLKGGNFESATMMEGDGSVTATDIFALGVHIYQCVDFGPKLKSPRGESIGNDTAFHIRSGGPGGPGEVGSKFEGKPTIQITATQEGVGTSVDSFRINSDCDGKVLGGKFAVGNLIGEKGGYDILCPLSFRILAEAEEKISS